MDAETTIAKAITKCKQAAINSISTCYYPGCNEKSINSHILQKNGILSRIATEGHVYDLDLDQFRNPIVQFKRKGLNKVMSFNCFCNKHDTELFKVIEDAELDFTDYKTNLLFTVRAAHNELFRKQVNILMNEGLKFELSEQFDNDEWQKHIDTEELGVKDLKQLIHTIWDDLENDEEAFVFNHRKLNRFDLCLSSFYTHETTIEMKAYYDKHGKHMANVSDIFINYFPMENSSILMMGYLKANEHKVKGSVNRLFKENEKRVERILTNLLLFRCETWVISEDVFTQKAKGLEFEFSRAIAYAISNFSERRNLDLNIFRNDFKHTFQRMFGANKPMPR